MNDRYTYCLRLNLKNPRHAEIVKRLGSLNTKVFKSRSEFLVRAVEHYIACMDSGDMEVPERETYVTVDRLEERLDQMEKDIRLRLYEDMLRILAAGTSVPGRSVNEILKISDGVSAAGSKEVDLTQFSDIMRDIESFSSN